jgi:hypothetical protein
MKRPILFALLLIALFLQSSAGPRANADDGDRQRFIGAWRLVSDQSTLANGKIAYEYGPRAVGYLVYDPSGHMCVGLMNPERPKWTAPKKLMDQEKILMFDSFYAYCGKYEVNEAEHVMMHLPELASTPDYVNSHQPRPYTFEGDRVTFTGKNAPFEGGGTWKIIWEKAK